MISDGVRVFVDPKSFLYLHGMTLDYEDTLMRRFPNYQSGTPPDPAAAVPRVLIVGFQGR